MTFILGMSKADGIYLSVDYRVTNARTGALMDDKSIKHLTIHYPPHQGGPRALLAFTGLAKLPDGTETLTWIRQTMRGEVETVDQSMAHLRARLDRDIAPLKVGLIINLLGIMGARRFYGGFTNMRQDPSGRVSIIPKFGYKMTEPKGGLIIANGSGLRRAQVDGHLDRLEPHLNVVPREPMNHMNLLATVNRKVAFKESTVSPFCHVSFISSDPNATPLTHSFTERGESVPVEMPVLAQGLDIMEFTHMLYGPGFQQLLKDKPISLPTNEEINRRMNRKS